MPPKAHGILESSLYVSDLPRSVRFYEEIFGFHVIAEFGERGCAMTMTAFI
jgi:catechol 2,3-dioxygenase-like lactoylglutathione lyase family enzyme